MVYNVHISRPTRCTNSYNVSLLIIKCSTCFGLFESIIRRDVLELYIAIGISRHVWLTAIAIWCTVRTTSNWCTVFYATGNFIAAFRLVRLHQERFLKCYLLSFCLYLENPWTPLKEIWCWLIVYKKVFNFSFS